MRENFKNIENCFRRLQMKIYHANDPLRIKVYFIKFFGLCLKNWILFCKLAPKICV